jgi:hypothetical protein
VAVQVGEVAVAATCTIKGCGRKSEGEVSFCSGCRSVLEGDGDKEARKRVLAGALTGDLDMDAILLRSLDVLVVKGADYTIGTGDRLHNFKTSGEFNGITPARALNVLLYKHYASVSSYVKSEGQSESEPIEERLVDVINYCLLLGKLVAEAKRGDRSLLVSPGVKVDHKRLVALLMGAASEKIEAELRAELLDILGATIAPERG